MSKQDTFVDAAKTAAGVSLTLLAAVLTMPQSRRTRVEVIAGQGLLATTMEEDETQNQLAVRR